MRKNFTCLFFCLILLQAAWGQSSKKYPVRDFRAVWITTVNNIDWPSQRSLPSDAQKEEFFRLLWYFQKYHINAVMFQVRPAADAFYESPHELWSEYLNGAQGKPPSPYYDPLTFAIEQCHQRNIEFHAWFNPYRAVANLETSKISSEHITNKQPKWFFKYGNKKYFNPGIPEVRQYIVSVIMDVVHRYDVDGIHFDDYFYPYKIMGEDIDDDWTFELYNEGFNDREDWRRHNVDLLIKSLRDSLQAVKPHVKVGVSPVGAWRNQSKDPRGSATRVGQPAYDYLYADIRKWLQKGWIDYAAPQLYWSTRSRYGDYRVLVAWWHKNSFGKHIYTGNAIFKLGDASGDRTWASRQEFGRQMRINHLYSAVKGSIFFSTRFLIKNPLNILDTLRKNYFKAPALVPTMAWKDSIPPNLPQQLQAEDTEKGTLLSWEAPPPAKDGETATSYLVYRFKDEFSVDFTNRKAFLGMTRGSKWLDPKREKKKRYYYVLIALDRMQNESEDFVGLPYVSHRKLTQPRQKKLKKLTMPQLNE
ncbi:MAG: glycoside hydrolase family 10 protein [Thermonemataceae bacterium]